MAIEDEFDIEVPDEDAEKFQTVSDIVKYVEDKAQNVQNSQKNIKPVERRVLQIMKNDQEKSEK